jgi:hypothetical protein
MGVRGHPSQIMQRPLVVAGIYNHSRYERAVRAALATWDRHLTALTEGRE